MSEKKKVQLDKPFTWAGINYGAGINDLPAKGADYAVKRKFGALLGEGAEVAANVPADFTPLSLEETLKRMTQMDLSDDVLDSLKVHRDVITSSIKEGKTFSEIVGESGGAGAENDSPGDPNAAGNKSGVKTEGDGKNEAQLKAEAEAKTQTQTKVGLPEDFPMKHVFERPNVLAEKGFQTVAEIQAISAEKLISIDGIAEKTAEKALNYGK